MFFISVGAVVAVPNLLLKSLASVCVGISIARLFVLGHDACHQSLFTNRRVNRWLGRMLFLPSLTPFSLWEVGHNLGHHVYTNLRGMDYVWTPMSKAEFDSSPVWRQWLERFYRSGWGHGAYYLIELWWKKLFFPSRTEISNRRRMFFADSALVSCFAILWLATLTWLAMLMQQGVAVVVLLGLIAPLLIWSSVMGSVIFFHHTHPLLPWYVDIDRWEQARDRGGNTVHVELGWRWGRILNNIMEHPAHHLDVRVPLYRLEAAQRMLDASEHAERHVSSRALRACVSRCKLYDYQASRWTDFAGRPTGPILRDGRTASPT